MKLDLADLHVDPFPTLPEDPEVGPDGFPVVDPRSVFGGTCFCY